MARSGPKKKFEGKAVRATVLIPPKVYARLSELAKQQRRTVSAQVVFLITEALPVEEEDDNEPDQIRRPVHTFKDNLR